MSDPTTSNILLAVPTRGSDAGTWDLPVNSNSTALDGYIGGLQTISVSGGASTLTAPSGTVTAGSGPFQSQNSILRFTGALGSNQTVTLPLPGYYIVQNVTTGNFLLTFRAAGAGQVICVDQGEYIHIFNDGTNVFFANLDRVGAVEIWAGVTSMPAWVTNCTFPPYVYCDGTVYNVSTYPYLGKKLQAQFGGNGSTTFGVPDLRGRVALPYDGTGARITAAVCGITGTVLGSAADNQGVPLIAAQIPTITSAGVNAITVGTTVAVMNGGAVGNVPQGSNFGISGNISGVTSTGSNNISVTSNNTAGQVHNNVQPSIMTGIAVIRAA